MVTLAVDDSLTIAQQIRDCMTEIDPEGTHFAGDDPEEMLGIVAEKKPDIVWLDVVMPGMDGLEMAAEIRQLSPDSNIVFVTGHPGYALDAFGVHASGYVLKPVTKEKLAGEIADLRRPVRSRDKDLLRVQCFGNFEVFGRDGIMRFSRKLSKEAFAYLIDRRGAGCTVGEICSVLWEDRQSDKNLKSQCRVILGALKKDLTEAGYGDVIVKGWNVWGVDTNRVSCDYYDFLKGDKTAMESFLGEYMAQYSWSEMTVGSLVDIK